MQFQAVDFLTHIISQQNFIDRANGRSNPTFALSTLNLRLRDGNQDNGG
jgi:hypothetical protein